MKRSLRFTCWLLAGMLAPCALRAVVATSLDSFEGIEEPLVRYAPGPDAFTSDAFSNITENDGVFRMQLRYRSNEWDGDRDTPNRDRQRAEVKGLGAHQQLGETFEYTTTWRTNPDFRTADRFCHLFQLKSTDGDSGAPLVTLSLLAGEGRVAVQYWPGHAKSSITAQAFSWTPGKWQTVRIRIKTSQKNDGEVQVSVDGGPFQGVQGVAVYRPDGTDYRPKWGFYRGVKADLPLADGYVEHKDVSAEKDPGAVPANAASLEISARRLAEKSPVDALIWLQTQPPSAESATAVATIAAGWARRDPVAAMAWVGKLSAAQGQSDAMMRVFNRWADQDADAVLRWAAAQQPSAGLDSMLWYFATDTTLRYTTRDKALAGAALIGNSGPRERALEHVVLIWARHEPSAAAHYVEASPALTAEQKAALQQKISPAAK